MSDARFYDVSAIKARYPELFTDADQICVCVLANRIEFDKLCSFISMYIESQNAYNPVHFTWTMVDDWDGRLSDLRYLGGDAFIDGALSFVMHSPGSFL